MVPARSACVSRAATIPVAGHADRAPPASGRGFSPDRHCRPRDGRSPYQADRTAAFRELACEESRLHTPEQCIDVLQRFLIERLRNASVHGVVARALREIEREHGCLRVAEIAARCHVSPRHLNRLMRDWVGYGPKYFANMVRFQATLKQIEDSPTRPAAALASETGYFDQAHLTLDLARFAAATPRQLASSRVADFSKTRCDDPP